MNTWNELTPSQKRAMRIASSQLTIFCGTYGEANRKSCLTLSERGFLRHVTINTFAITDAGRAILPANVAGREYEAENDGAYGNVPMNMQPGDLLIGVMQPFEAESARRDAPMEDNRIQEIGELEMSEEHEEMKAESDSVSESTARIMQPRELPLMTLSPMGKLKAEIEALKSEQRKERDAFKALMAATPDTRDFTEAEYIYRDAVMTREVELAHQDTAKLQAELDAARADGVKLTARNHEIISLLDWFVDFAGESAKKMNSLLIPLELTDMLEQGTKALNARE